MKGKLYRVFLSKEKSQKLRYFVKNGHAKAKEILRARILLLADESPDGGKKTDSEIADELDICLRMVALTREKFAANGNIDEAIKDKARPGQPRKLDGRKEAQLTAIACTSPPEGRGRWTLRLLADEMVRLEYIEDISHETVRKVLKKTNSSRGFRKNGV